MNFRFDISFSRHHENALYAAQPPRPKTAAAILDVDMKPRLHVHLLPVFSRQLIQQIVNALGVPVVEPVPYGFTIGSRRKTPERLFDAFRIRIHGDIFKQPPDGLDLAITLINLRYTAHSLKRVQWTFSQLSHGETVISMGGSPYLARYSTNTLHFSIDLIVVHFRCRVHLWQGYTPSSKFCLSNIASPQKARAG